MVVVLRLLCLAGLALGPVTSPAQETPLPARPVSLCDAPADCGRIGRIRLLDVLDLKPVDFQGLRFAELSGLAWDDDEGLLYALSDQGKLFALRPQIRKGRLTGVTLVHGAALTDPLTGKPVKWRRADSEDLDLLNGRNGRQGDTELLVSFEREPRIARYHPDGRYIADLPLPAVLRDPQHYRGGNKMLEAVCQHPRAGVLTAPEEPLEEVNGETRLYRMDGSSWRFSPGRGAVVALECPADGDVLVLEREFIPASLRTVISLRRLRLPAGAAADSWLESETLAELDSNNGLRLDNFEGLTRHQGNRYFMVSDNNDVFLQRTLLVYFELLPD